MTPQSERPIPEAIAGAIVGFQLSVALALYPGAARYIEDPATAPFILGVGVLAGAVASWILAAPARKTVRVSSRDSRPTELRRIRAA